MSHWYHALLLACISTGLTACTFISKFEECESNSDCASGTCDDGLCAVSTCESHEDCGSIGADYRCIHQACVLFDDPLCSLETRTDSETASLLHIGALMPLSGRNAVKGDATAKAATTAFEQINLTANGIGGVQLATVICDTENNADSAEARANYLVNQLGVDAIIGSISSGETLRVAERVTIPAGAVLITPGSTSPAISNLDDADLVWRTIPSDAQQGPALAWAAQKAGHDNVAILSVESAYGQGLFDAFVGSGLLEAELRPLTYEVDEAGEFVPDSFVDKATGLFVDDGFVPDAIVVMGSVESQQLIFALDDNFFGTLTDDEKPIWILSEAGRDVGLLDDRFADIWPRITGTFIPPNTDAVYEQFVLRFEAAYELTASEHVFADKAYDAAFLLGLAYGSAESPYEVTGPDIGAALKRTVGGDGFRPGSDDFAAASATLGAGALDYMGASGSLDFDPETGDVPANVSAWSITLDDQMRPNFVDDGVIYTASGETQ